jgi:hypothetical protein
MITNASPVRYRPRRDGPLALAPVGGCFGGPRLDETETHEAGSGRRAAIEELDAVDRL